MKQAFASLLRLDSLVLVNFFDQAKLTADVVSKRPSSLTDKQNSVAEITRAVRAGTVPLPQFGGSGERGRAEHIFSLEK